MEANVDGFEGYTQTEKSDRKTTQTNRTMKHDDNTAIVPVQCIFKKKSSSQISESSGENSGRKKDFHRRRDDSKPMPGSYNTDSYESSTNVPLTHNLQSLIEEKSECEYCMICADPVEFWAIGGCNHPICSLCAARVRIRSKDRACVVCKQTVDVMVVFPAANRPAHAVTFLSFGVYDCSQMPGFIASEVMGMMFTVACQKDQQHLERMRSFACPVRGCSERPLSFESLQTHLKTVHGKQICVTCFEHRPLFIPELPLYTPQQLDVHIKSPPSALVAMGEDKIGGHPSCRFCSTIFFDAHHLLQHMRAQHPTCPVCRPTPPLLKYFNDEASLWDHIQRDHTFCPICLEGMGRNVCAAGSYSNRADLASHMRVQHGYEGGSGDRSGGGRKGLRYLELDPSLPDPYAVASSRARKGEPRGPAPGVAQRQNAGYAAAAAIIPAHMRVAGRITGTGNFQRDAADDALEAYSNELHSKSRRSKARTRTQDVQLFGDSSSQLAADFPSLASANATPAFGSTSASTSSQPSRKGGSSSAARPAIKVESANQVTSVCVEMQLQPRVGDEDGLASDPSPKQQRQRPSKGSTRSSAAGGGGGLTSLSAQLQSMGLGCAVSGVGKKLVESTLQREKQLEKDRKDSRAKMLADAFGVTDSEKDKEGGLDRRALGKAEVSESHLQRWPLFPSSLLAWAKKQRPVLLKVEKRLFELLSDAAQSSVSLSPMEAADRRGVHMLCRHYRLNSYVFEHDHKKYISVVKAPDSLPPPVLLSEASTASQYQSYTVPLINAPSEGRAGQPIILLEPSEVDPASSEVPSGRPSSSPSSSSASPTVGLLLRQLREVGVLCGAVLTAEAQEAELARARSSGLPVARVLGYSSVVVEFPTFLAAFRAHERISSYSTPSSSSRGKQAGIAAARPTSVFPFWSALAFAAADLEAEAGRVLGSSADVDSHSHSLPPPPPPPPPGFGPLDGSGAHSQRSEHSIAGSPRSDHRPNASMSYADEQVWPSLDVEPQHGPVVRPTQGDVRVAAGVAGAGGDRTPSSNAFDVLWGDADSDGSS